MQPRLFYLYDALCGWCYGFSPVMETLYRLYKGKIHFEVISGGMRLGAHAGPLKELAPYIQNAYKDVETRTGVKFGEHFLKNLFGDADLMMDSFPPAVALSIVKEAQPEQALAAASAIQRMIYKDGHSPTDWSALSEALESTGLDAEMLLKKANDERYHQLAYKDFALTQKWGVQGFPAVIAENKNKLVMIAQGYTECSVMQERIVSTFKLEPEHTN